MRGFAARTLQPKAKTTVESYMTLSHIYCKGVEPFSWESVNFGEGWREELQVSSLPLNHVLLCSQRSGIQSQAITDSTVLPGLVFSLFTAPQWSLKALKSFTIKLMKSINVV